MTADFCGPAGTMILWRLRVAEAAPSMEGKYPERATPRAARASCTRSRASLRSRFCLADRSTSELSSGSWNEDHQSSFSIGVAAVPRAAVAVHCLGSATLGLLQLCPTAHPASK